MNKEGRKTSVSEKSCYEEKRGRVSTRYTIIWKLLYRDIKYQHINFTYQKQNDF